MKKQLLSFFKILVPITIVLIGLQYYFQAKIYTETEFFYSVWSIYAFHVVITIVLYIAILSIHKILPHNTGFVFLGFSGLKMLAAIVFLIPLFQASLENPIPTVFSFFIPYFVYLFLEAFFVIKLLK
ncbi:hypothetical protein HX109_05265 [Galbibacter sp. BG1]|uniref:hypothetical protein n=1 Tax=Galbibacter sp. BG1 TaxID=1170699 RepID=UPI0015BF4634|nr:hypothetical protein [Galbibacter sp. BG1]QLE01002.1 hypothetical protein HX109_05265 [Galbibacter sp. BG1]